MANSEQDAGTAADGEQAWHALPFEDVLASYNVDAKNGLSAEEVERLLEEFGPNEVPDRPGPSALRRFLSQLNQPLVVILIVAGLVTLVLGEYVDSGVIFGVVVVNATVGFIQESRAVSALAALSRVATMQAVVRRGGATHEVASRDLVPGDIVLLQSGDKIPADIRFVRVRDLQVDESALTGESVPVQKATDVLPADTVLGDRTNLGFASTLVTYGQAEGVVVNTGAETEVGAISEMIASAEQLATPLTRRLAAFSRILLLAIVVLAAATFAVGVLRGQEASEMFLAAVALAVGAIPEGLPAAVTITLAIGVNRMAGRRAIVRSLPAVETLGGTTVICSDKTGTLTENQMTVQAAWAGADFRFSGIGYSPEGDIEPPPGDTPLDRCLLAGLHCNDSAIAQHEGRWVVRGDPTEGALITAAHKAGFEQQEQQSRFTRIDTVPFESQHQYMATLHETPGGAAPVAFLKGSAEAVVQRCERMLDSSGEPVTIDPDAIHDVVYRLAAEGLRVLAFAEREMPAGTQSLAHEDVSEGLTFVGLQGMLDPPRREAIEAVEACKRAGITVKMITGDHAGTAAAIASQLGIGTRLNGGANGAPRALTGRDLDDITDRGLVEVAEEVDVFARVPPEGKLRLVRALQERRHIVAMTGDGVNDAPALRQADIGVAMGRGGTEVARDAADIVLTDDNFASIEAAVEEGRCVYDNLMKFITWTLPTNLGEGLIILVAVLVGATLPVLPVQILWINMTTAVLLGLMLAFEPPEGSIMSRPPREPHSRLLSGALMSRIAFVGLLLLAGSFALFDYAQSQGESDEFARTVAVNVFVFVELFYLFNCRSHRESPFAIGFFSNRWVLVGVASMLVLQMLFTYAPPMQALFGSEAIGLDYWALILGWALVAFVLVEVEKRIRLRMESRWRSWRLS